MSTTSITLEFNVSGAADAVFGVLTQAEKFVAVHPIIYRMEERAPGEYLVHEKIQLLGFIPYAFTYTARISFSTEAKTVQMKADIQGRVFVTMDFEVLDGADQETSKVLEKVHFQSKLPVLGILKSLFKKQHQKLFENISKQLLEQKTI